MSTSIPLNERSHAVIEIKLPTVVKAADLAALLGAMNTLYNNRLWIDYANMQPTHPFVYAAAPDPAEELIVEWLAIGTPNVLALRGLGKHIAAVGAVLAALLGPTQIASETYKNIQEARKIEQEIQREPLEIQKKNLEIKKLKIEVQKSLDEMKVKGTIDKEKLDQIKLEEVDAENTIGQRKDMILSVKIILIDNP